MRDGTKLYRCPSKVIRSDVKIYIDWYNDFKNGWLPFRGTKNEQPIKIMQIFDIIELEQHRVSKEQNELLGRIVKDGSKQKENKNGR